MSHSLRHLKEALPNCVAVGVVDMNEGVVLEACDDGANARETLSPQATAARALLHTADARTAAAILDRARGGDGHATFQDAVVGAENAVYVLQRRDDARAVVAVFEGVTNLGRVIAETRTLGRGMPDSVAE